MSSLHFSANPLLIGKAILEHWDLISQLAKRSVASRYRGSILGMAWSLFIPILMLLVYTFVFGVIFKARWSQEGTGTLNFASVLFSGMIVHGFFSECLARSTGLITGHSQYVKKVVFPLDILPWPAIATALFQACVSFCILFIYLLFLNQKLPWTVIFLPLVFAPIVILAAAVGWFMSATTVYLRDVTQVIGVLTTVMLFISPIFYPLDALPDMVRGLIYLNPISFIVEQVREIVIFGRTPSFLGLFVYASIASTLAMLSFAWFQRLRIGFADVV